VKVKELFEAGMWTQFLGGLAGKSPSQVEKDTQNKQARNAIKDLEDLGKKLGIDTTPGATVKKTTDQEQVKKVKPQKQGPVNDPNENINTKIEYLKQQGELQSGRITDDERRYIDSVDVYVDPHKFDKEDPSTRFIKSRPPHHMNFQTSVQIPMKDWQKAIGREGSGLTGYVTFDLTPAGWWSNDFKAYINPNNKLDDLVTGFQK
jgi:hypothetical protein